MEISFLGTGAGSFQGSRRHPCSAFVDGVLLDCGTGATGRLEDAGLFDQVDGVVISHLHTDHFAGLFDFLLHTVITERRRPLTILSPPGLSGILKAMNAVEAMVFDPATRYELRVVEKLRPGAEIGSWKVEGLPLDHSIYNLGYRLTSSAGSVFYTGDTREPSGAPDVRCDVLIHESTYADRYADQAHRFGHSTASQAARAAVQMRARHLFLTHLGSIPDTDVEVVREARAVFPGAEVANDLIRYTI